MNIISKWLSEIFPGEKPRSALVDGETQKLLLSAAGNVGGDLCDVFLSSAQTDDQSFVIAFESGLFGVAIASYFFAVRYVPNCPSIALATQIADAYCGHYTELSHSKSSLEGATRMTKYFAAESRHALATTLGAIQMHGHDSKKLSWELSRVLASRIRINGRLSLEIERINLAEQKTRLAIEALNISFTVLRG